MIVGVVLVTAVTIILLNLAVDLALYAIDPTIARQGRKAFSAARAS